MKKRLTPLLFLTTGFATSFGQCPPPNYSTRIEQNGIGYYLSSNGMLWHNDTSESAGYHPILDSTQTTIYAGSFWFAGLDENKNLYVSANSHHNQAFQSGPIDSSTGLAVHCEVFDTIWQISQNEISQFMNGGNVTLEIEQWPGRGNPNIPGIPNQELAPFADMNEDGIYNPYDGDYPLIKGDYATWQVFNDLFNSPNLNSPNLGLEVHLMTYTYANNTSDQSQSFYDLKVKNKSQINFSEFECGVFIDGDIGCSDDDMAGTDSISNSMFFYNGTFNDNPWPGNCPNAFKYRRVAQGISFLKEPTNISASTSGDVSAILFMRDGATYHADPDSPEEFYNYMNSKWIDGTPLLFGGKGHISDINASGTTNFILSGSPCDSTQWNVMHTPTVVKGDYRGVLSSNLLHYAPDETVHMCFVNTYIEMDSAFSICDPAAMIATTATQTQGECDSPMSITEPSQNIKFSVLPNPSSGRFEIQNSPRDAGFELFDMNGRFVTAIKNTTFDISDLNAGVYFLRIKSRQPFSPIKLIKTD